MTKFFQYESILYNYKNGDLETNIFKTFEEKILLKILIYYFENHFKYLNQNILEILKKKKMFYLYAYTWNIMKMLFVKYLYFEYLYTNIDMPEIFLKRSG